MVVVVPSGRWQRRPDARNEVRAWQSAAGRRVRFKLSSSRSSDRPSSRQRRPLPAYSQGPPELFVAGSGRPNLGRSFDALDGSDWPGPRAAAVPAGSSVLAGLLMWFALGRRGRGSRGASGARRSYDGMPATRCTPKDCYANRSAEFKRQVDDRHDGRGGRGRPPRDPVTAADTVGSEADGPNRGGGEVVAHRAHHRADRLDCGLVEPAVVGPSGRLRRLVVLDGSVRAPVDGLIHAQ